MGQRSSTPLSTEHASCVSSILNSSPIDGNDENAPIPLEVVIGFGSQSGNTAEYSKMLQKRLENIETNSKIQRVSLENVDPEDFAKKKHQVFLVLISTYENGQPPLHARSFCMLLETLAADWRAGPQTLTGLQFAVLGCGNSSYGECFNTVGKQIHRQLMMLGAKPILAFASADDSAERKKNGTAAEDFDVWAGDVEKTLKKMQTHTTLDAEKDEEEVAAEASEGDGETEDAPDVEDLGRADLKVKDEGADEKPLREMLNPTLRKNLMKQQYRLIGSHSGVKLCRWTKSGLRGKGMCYKHSHYGITSYQCMEFTPSLACANKCVFCWRHHTQPAAKDWQWVMDPPEQIVEQALQQHRALIKQYKGVPGVLPDRLADAMKIKHCALSLVGEPIMYPAINEVCRILHGKGISSFLVTNAQHPDRIAQLEPVTQLYVSVDAPTPETLKAVDRPLHKDFWERFIECLKLLREKSQRTVYRLTLVKERNMQHLAEYAKLVQIGRPTFIELKGFTYCGRSDGSDLRVSNVPWHFEVRAFSEELCKYLDDNYEIAAEHEHSCSVLIADVNLKLDGKWHTWIDYERFIECVSEYYRSGKTFTALDYVARTPDWAAYNSEERGFNPSETKEYTHGAKGEELRKRLLQEQQQSGMSCCSSSPQQQGKPCDCSASGTTDSRSDASGIAPKNNCLSNDIQ